MLLLLTDLSRTLSRRHTAWVLVVIVALACGVSMGQDNNQNSAPENEQSCSTDGEVRSESVCKHKDSGNFVKVLAQDQVSIWTSPLHLRTKQIPSLLIFGAATAALTQADTRIESHVNESRTSTFAHASDAGLGLFAGAATAFYVSGVLKSNPHARETGVLISEAALNAFAMNSALQAAFRRARPDEAGAGDFFHGGSSFPSNHSAIAWSAATVIAHEYPGWGTKLLSYGLASAVSAARVGGRKHFTSDVLVGGALGWFVGQEIYHKRHNEALPGEVWQKSPKVGADTVPNPMHQGSSYVPLDSWTYEAVDRLAALGCIPNGFTSLRPWTRTEFARLLKQANPDVASDAEVGSLYEALRREFTNDEQVLEGSRNLRATVDSVYTRFTQISGPPLTDSRHFGQSLINDYGRPFQRGFNVVTGFSTHAEAGPFAFFARGEYQHTPSSPALNDNARSVIANWDALPLKEAAIFPEVNRFRLLDSYVALNVLGWQASFGKQSLWWGPGMGGDLMFSNNAEPVTMLRLTRVTPFELPSVLGLLGGIRNDAFLGRIEGYNFLRLGPEFLLTGSYDRPIDPQPYIWGEKIAFQPTPNLQFGVSITTIFAGLGRPLTFDTFLHSFSSSGNGQPVEPGDRRTGFDFSYRIPGLRNWLVLYNGSMTEDEPNPIAYPRRSAMNPGVYLPRIPKLHKLDLRVETGYTNLPNDRRAAVFFRNWHYAGGYTNYGQIMGSWLGPQARAYQVWSNYWRSGTSKFQVGYRRQTVDPTYAGGGTLQDISGRYDFQPTPTVAVSTGLQYERWNFPVLAAQNQSNVALSLQITYRPGAIRGAHSSGR